MDLDAYCARIGYAGPRTPTLGTLRALQELHPAAIPFEAIDVLLGRSIDLSPEAVDAKLIAARRGGYCYEQNGLFKRVLTAMGFEVEGLLARVLWTRPADAPLPPRSHMVLRVTIDGEAWLADVGFGASMPTWPLRLDTEEPQPTRHETYRLRPHGRDLRLEAKIDGDWLALHQLGLEPVLDVDYEPINWYTATHPSSHFRHRLSVARSTPRARFALSDNRLTVRTPDGHVERRMLTADGLERVLRETFLLPVQPAWRPLLERAAMAVN
jgi:N-hydroxyarylamine O-acetyltransferase